MNTYSHILPASLRVLIYFDIFRYPLTKEEIRKMIPYDDEASLEFQLNKLVKDSIVYHIDGLYGLVNDKKYFEWRKKGNLRAKKNEKKAFKKARLISKFPYVRGVFISGSFSKGHMLPDGDVDFFILTKHNRMWLSRTMLILYKKVFLFNSRKYFCLNYFKGEDTLTIEEQNIFTATELFTILPVVSNGLYKELINKNSWISNYYELDKIDKKVLFQIKNSRFKEGLENIFNNNIGERLDKFFMKLTLKRWKVKFGNMNEKDFELAMKSSRNVSKHHPSNFQKKVISEYNSKCKSFAEQYAKSII